ncbi:unnamed protein product, partial [Amoebophrya sp. A25]|eukprot:GSA25T00022059001.1
MHSSSHTELSYYWRFHTLRSPWRSRSFFGSAVLENRFLIVFGGVGGDQEYLNDVWITEDLWSWRPLTKGTSSKMWAPRCAFGVVTLPGAASINAGKNDAGEPLYTSKTSKNGAGSLLLLGGRGDKGRLFRDVWMLKRAKHEHEKHDEWHWERVTK